MPTKTNPNPQSPFFPDDMVIMQVLSRVLQVKVFRQGRPSNYGMQVIYIPWTSPFGSDREATKTNVAAVLSKQALVGGLGGHQTAD